jgi:serine/threonine-protein kinase
MRVRLTVEEGPSQGRTFTFENDDVFVVGRAPQAHLRLPRDDPYFSRLHFVVEVRPPVCRLVDTGSRNGTYLNGQRVQEAELRAGDRIRAGRTVLRLDVEAGGGEDLPWWCDERTPPTQPAANPLDSGQTAPHIPPPPAGEPIQLPGYQLVRELGRGHMGAVHLARRESDGVEVAVKLVVPAMAGDRLVERFLREADILRCLDHPGIVRFLDLGKAGDALFFVMEYVRGGDLRDVFQQQGRLGLRVAVRIVCPVLAALEYAHQSGFVHRDVKPSNVLLEDRGGGKRAARLADFGLGRVYGASRLSKLTMMGEVGGTPAYMPPEQIVAYRDVGPAADQYSTAAMLYHLLTGQFVYDLPPMPGALAVIIEDQPVPIRQRRPELPESFAEVIHRSLRKEPAERYPSAEAFRQALAPFGR